MTAPVTQITAALFLRALAAASEAAVKAGLPPAPDWRAADGLSRREAQALYAWARGLPGVYEALTNRSNASHAEVNALHDLLNYFAHDHPERDDGSPASWSDLGSPPLSPAMSRFLIEGQDIPIAELRPAEAAELTEHAAAIRVAATDTPEFGATLAALRERAVQPEEPESVPAPSAEEEGSSMTREEAQARYDELARGMNSSASATDKSAWADEMAEIAEAFPDLRARQLSTAEFAEQGKRREHALPAEHFTPRMAEIHETLLASALRKGPWMSASDRRALVAEFEREATGAGAGGGAAAVAPRAATPAPQGAPQRGPIDPGALIRELDGLTGAARRAALEERFGTITEGTPTPGMQGGR